jgi:serine/threonine-protein kinase
MTPPEPEAPAVQPPLFDAVRAALSGRYDVQRELGRGGMATVFLARDVRHDRAVAIKVLARDVVATSGADRFLHEIRIAARLTHPHVLGVHDSGEADGLLYYVMPYVDGETLRARMTRDGSLPITDAIRLVRELADALAYAHANGVVHRDLKPENVLLSGGHAVVADFGIAKALAAATQGEAGTVSRLTATGVSLGTPAYMAPEQAVGDQSTDHRADLYSLGVVAYEIVTGAHPFSGRTAHAIVTAHLTETPARLRSRRVETPAALDALVMQLLAKDPANRPQTADLVLRSLDGGSATGIPTIGRMRRIAVRSAAALVVLTAVGYGAWRAASRSAPTATAIHTLAVLPFANIGGGADDEYFSDGMTDELAHALGRLPGLTLAGRTSAYAFKGKAVPAQEIGRVLGVAAFVSGTVRRAGDRLRVTTQLVKATDGKVMWDSVYESHSSDVFAVQDELTRAIVAALEPTLGGHVAFEVGRGTNDEAAYELFMKGRFYLLARGRDNVIRSIDYFKQAIARDSNFARAHAGLATAYSILAVYVPDPKDTIPALVAASAQRAMKLDSTVADAQMAMAAAARLDLRLGEATAHSRAAIAREPSRRSPPHGMS